MSGITKKICKILTVPVNELIIAGDICEKFGGMKVNRTKSMYMQTRHAILHLPRKQDWILKSDSFS